MRNPIAIKLVLGLALFLALFFAAAGMSFWQAGAVDRKTENIVQSLEPKRTVAFEMQLTSVETEKGILEYLRSPSPEIRMLITESTSQFGRFQREYLRLGTQEELDQVSGPLDEVSLGYQEDSRRLMGLAERKHGLWMSLEMDFEALASLSSINIGQNMALHSTCGALQLVQLQVMETAIAEINSKVAAYLRSPSQAKRDSIDQHS